MTYGRSRPIGFTLIELVVAVSLLVMLMLSVSFVFDMAGKTISEAQAGNEMSACQADFYETIRKDLRGAEHGGWLAFGKRPLPGTSGKIIYGSRSMREHERKADTRCDWMFLVTVTEQASAVDNRLVAQWNRIMYGHGRKTNPSDSSNFSQYATDWVLMRHQAMTLWSLPLGVEQIETVQPGTYGMNSRAAAVLFAAGVEGLTDQTGGYCGMWPNERTVKTYYHRDMRWYWYGAEGGYHWNGTVATPNYSHGDNPGMAIYEPTYWQTYIYGTHGGSAKTRFQALPHCGQFRVEYAMANDLRNGTNGSIRWWDPPAVGESSYQDPNHRPGDSLHKHSPLPASGEDAGRLVFGPGDNWPVLLRITTTIYDPKERLDRGRTACIIVPVAQ